MTSIALYYIGSELWTDSTGTGREVKLGVLLGARIAGVDAPFHSPPNRLSLSHRLNTVYDLASVCS